MDINNSEQYIILEISSKLDCMDKREFTSSKPRDYMVIPGNGMTTSLSLRTKRLTKNTRQGFPLLILITRIVGSFSGSLIIQIIQVTRVNRSIVN